MKKITRMGLWICIAALLLSCFGCADRMCAAASVPEIPEKLKKNDQGVPIVRLYDVDNQKIEEIDIERYVMGVVAGEMRNDWPMEALKAQAILARTFTMKFLSTKESRYEGADISTDIHEAQAYDALAVNDRIRQAVEETRGVVMVADGDFPHAWFHAHAGGKTEMPTKALDYSEDPPYLSVVDSQEAEEAPEEVKNWTAVFTLDEVLDALRKVGIEIEALESFEIGERGESGRAATFLVNGKSISAPTFRLQIGASKLKSTLVESVTIDGEKIIFRGSGFGHGVGMSQWGAYAMAEEGKDYKRIIGRYFKGIELVRLWK